MFPAARKVPGVYEDLVGFVRRYICLRFCDVGDWFLLGGDSDGVWREIYFERYRILLP